MSNNGTFVHDSNYWSIDIPGLTEPDVYELMTWLSRSRPLLQGTPVNPRDFLTLHLDRTGAETIRNSLAQAARTDASDGLVEIIDEWLDFTDAS
jgi:hypothetical protein